MKALVIGSTGLVGSEVIFQLCKDSDCKAIHTIGRRSGHKADKITDHILNLDLLKDLADSLKDLFNDDDIAICCLGTTIKTAGSKEAFRKVDFQYVVAFAELCKAIGIENFGVVSATGSNARSNIFYSQVKGEMEEALVKMNFKSLVIARPGLLLGKRKELRTGERIMTLVMPLVDWIFIGPLAKWRSINAYQVAGALILNLKNPSQSIHYLEGRDIYLVQS